MRALFLLSILVFQSLGFLLVIALWVDMRRYLEAVPSIGSRDDLERFKGAVTRQMYGNLMLLAAVVVFCLLLGLGMVGGFLDFSEAMLLVLPPCILWLLWRWSRGVVREARTQPVADDALGQERDRVVLVWIRRIVPNW